MRIYDVIEKKKHGIELSDGEIHELVKAYTGGSLPDYQMAALLMAIYFKGMSKRETAALTDAMAKSGDTLDLSEFGSLTVDKHSTGGVGDKTTLIVAPIAAAAGCVVAKMSGRGLGHTGGTIDKLESFPGFRTDMTTDEFFDLVKKSSLAVVGQSKDLAPADKMLYALRDVTATVDSIPLIASSIMSKKLAAGTKSIVLDVKYGSGAFMKTEEDAEALAEAMIDIGIAHGRKMAALISNMDAPLGYAVGNSLEVCEAIDLLRGGGPEDLKEVCLELSSVMIELSLGISREEASRTAREVLNSGLAFEKFCEWIELQGGDAKYATDTSNFEQARFCEFVTAERDGYILRCDAQIIGSAAMTLGAGRKQKGDEIDHSAGIILMKKPSDKVFKGEKIAKILTNDQDAIPEASGLLQSAFEIAEKPVFLPKITHKLIKK